MRVISGGGLWHKAIATAGPAKAAMIYYALPLFSGWLAHLILQEEINSPQPLCLTNLPGRLTIYKLIK